jgi:O-methyltransferase involved in polyketide biosynthesis
VLETLRFVGRSCSPGSQIVFDFALPDELLGQAERSRRNHMAAIVSKIGEPWISWFDAGTLASDLLGIGFTQASSLGAVEANARYFNGRMDGIRVAGSGRIMTARI